MENSVIISEKTGKKKHRIIHCEASNLNAYKNNCALGKASDVVGCIYAR